MLFRVLFSTLLLGSSIIFQLGESPPPVGPPLVLLYGLIATIFFLSILYALGLYRIKHHIAFAYVQILIDTLVVTVILIVTGGFSSIFSFLYLVVIIYSSILLPIRGTIVIDPNKKYAGRAQGCRNALQAIPGGSVTHSIH